MSISDTYVIEFNAREAILLKANGTFVRRFTPRGGAAIVQASVNNAGPDTLVTLNYSNGRADIFRWTGALYRSL